MITRADIATAHQRLMSERLRIRRVLLNVTTTDAAIVHGARVCLHKQFNETHARPHHAYYFSVVVNGKRWKSRKWLVALNPTKASGKRMREGYHEAMRQTIEYLYALPEIEPPRCGYCGDVITRTDKRARFCSRYCQRENGKRTRIARMKGLKL